ncbi:sulfite exporter TauE/SafE family protein 3-like isoform X1 [Euphorbia lathyris]|uniref:sulfite exporter TauE/SafE family protein 3-like isoform X1 n=1 Tax=Euphorbia lathyris TaxID=212925 RepID=UPI003313F863
MIPRDFINILVLASLFIVAVADTQLTSTHNHTSQSHYGNRLHSPSKHVWPEMKFGWKLVMGTITGFIGAAFGSAAGIGGGGIFVPMLKLIIGFDAKSSIAISKCMVTGSAASTVYYNLNQRHPTLDMPLIDYDLALLFQPMLVLGVSIGVTFNVIFSEWMITVLLIIIFIFMSTKAFLRAIKTWNKETEAKKMEDAARCLESKFEVVVSKSSSEILSNKAKISVIENVYWKGVGLLFGVWFIILALQITKNYTKTCSVQYWILDFAQVPITSGLAIYETFRIYKGKRKISSKGEAGSNLSVPKLTFYCLCGLFAGIAGGLLGLGGGFILGPLFLEMGIPPQVSSATATFAMTFSASMSVVEYYLLKRIPIPYALYLFGVAIVAGIVGQYVVKKVIDMLGRASIIIFILSLTILISAIALGGVGIADMITDIEHKEYMGFENMCSLS